MFSGCLHWPPLPFPVLSRCSPRSDSFHLTRPLPERYKRVPLSARPPWPPASGFFFSFSPFPAKLFHLFPALSRMLLFLRMSDAVSCVYQVLALSFFFFLCVGVGICLTFPDSGPSLSHFLSSFVRFPFSSVEVWSGRGASRG